MDERLRNELARTCAPVLKRIEEWRRTRSRRNEPMPERLWAQAARLAREWSTFVSPGILCKSGGEPCRNPWTLPSRARVAQVRRARLGHTWRQRRVSV